MLILGLGPVGIGILRALRQYEDINLYGAVLAPGAEKGRFTKCCKVLSWPDPKSDESRFLQKFLQWAALREKLVVFATRDEEVYWLAKNADNLPPNILFYRNSLKQVMQLVDKNRVTELAISCGINIPKSYAVNRQLTIPDSFRFPGILKPSFLSSDKFPHKNLMVRDMKELETILEAYPSLIDSSVFQEFIPGGDDQMYECAFVTGKNGKMLGSIEFRKLRQYPVLRGISTFGYTLFADELSRLSDILIRRSGVTGMFSLEFKKDRRDDQWAFIEANLRMPGYDSVFSETDVPLARIYIDDLLDRYAENRKLENRKIVYWMREELDLANVLKGDVDTGLLKWFRDVVTADVFAFWDIADPFPGLINFYETATNIFKRLIRKN